LPFVCEEVWSWWQVGSVHHAPWPAAAELSDAAGDPHEDVALSLAADVLREVRKAKSQARRKMRAPVKRVIVHDTPERLAALELCSGDLLEAGAIEALEQREAEEFAVEIELAEETAE
jgi:valyl-tRNA synthetase